MILPDGSKSVFLEWFEKTEEKVLTAQKDILAIARRLESEGRIAKLADSKLDADAGSAAPAQASVPETKVEEEGTVNMESFEESEKK